MQTFLVGVGLAVIGLIASSCSEEAPTDFTQETQSDFMAACSDRLEDTSLVRDVCQCVFERTEVEIPFDAFSDTDNRLRQVPELALPEQIVGFIADCVVEEARL